MTDELHDERLSRLYREGAAGEPPPALDAAILAAARAAVVPAPRRRPGWRAWMLPMSLAATLVLTVSLTLVVQQEQEQERVGAEAPPSATPSKPAEAAKAEAAAPAVRQQKAATAIEQKAAAPSSGLEREEVRRQAEPLARPAATGAPAAPAVAAPPPAAADALESRAKAVAPLRKEAARAAVVRPPEQWLEEIRQLKNRGKEKEAAESLAAFRQAYPDYRLPEELR